MNPVIHPSQRRGSLAKGPRLTIMNLVAAVRGLSSFAALRMTTILRAVALSHRENVGAISTFVD